MLKFLTSIFEGILMFLIAAFTLVLQVLCLILVLLTCTPGGWLAILLLFLIWKGTNG